MYGRCLKTSYDHNDNILSSNERSEFSKCCVRPAAARGEGLHVIIINQWKWDVFFFFFFFFFYYFFFFFVVLFCCKGHMKIENLKAYVSAIYHGPAAFVSWLNFLDRLVITDIEQK